ncbi:prepilin-type N-terminal cleavage/methylation domain-containing protein [Candidatus Kaiserbacteria bacterium]|nr:prepilin-type N-terminal cleavage/methylation domain-containing protein [Candidatus Kaiserbacteria bacterium]
MKNYFNNHGFTLVEIIVVVSVITILAATALTQFGGAREQAQIVKAYNDILQFEVALNNNIVANENNWPVTSNSGVSIEDLYNCNSGCDFPDFSKYLSELPDQLPGSIGYYYHNGNQSYRCTGSNTFATGVNIRIHQNVSGTEGQKFMDLLYEYLDNKIDKDDDTNCGQVRRGGASHSIYYLIGDN